MEQGIAPIMFGRLYVSRPSLMTHRFPREPFSAPKLTSISGDTASQVAPRYGLSLRISPEIGQIWRFSGLQSNWRPYGILARYYRSREIPVTTAMTSRIRVYRKSTHHFFDDFVTFLCSLAGILISTEAFNSGGVTKAVADPKYYMQFTGPTLKVRLTWYPHKTLKIIASDRWPDEIELYEDRYHPRAPIFRLTTTGFKGLQALSIQASFIRYFETHRPQIEATYGSDPQRWPTQWNFARVVRNAFAHGGTINFRNPASPSVTWKSITYGPSDNGRQIVFTDVAAVEIISLMEDMDSVL